MSQQEENVYTAPTVTTKIVDPTITGKNNLFVDFKM